MRVLLWWPGAQFAVTDVANGLKAGLEAHGVDVRVYRTDQRLRAASIFLRSLWKVRGQRPEMEPSFADVVYQGSVGILEQALRTEPDWVIAVSGMYQHPDVLPLLRKTGVKVGLICTETPYDLAGELQLARLVDRVWTNERSAVDVFRTVNASTTYLRHAWLPAVHGGAAEVPADVAEHDVVFVGTGFVERIALLEGVSWDGIDLGLYGHWKMLGSRSRLRRFVRGGNVHNARAAALYRRARIGLNLHRTSLTYDRQTRHARQAESLNPRAYELAACGCFYVSDRRVEVDEVFGGLVPTVASAGELESTVRGWLAESAVVREQRAAAIADAVRGETWEARAAQVLGDLAAHNGREQAAAAA